MTLLLCIARFAWAAPPPIGEITVNTSTDDDDIDSPPNGRCTLREAMQDANSHSQWMGKTDCASGGVDKTVIKFSYTPIAIIINPEFGEIFVSAEVEILGPATISGPPAPAKSRIFHVTAAGNLTTTNVDENYGVGDLDSGGAGLVEGSGEIHMLGGQLSLNKADRGAGWAIYGLGEFEDVDVTANEAAIDGGAFWIGSNAVLILNRCTVAANRARRAGGGLFGDAGQPNITIVRTAFVGNRADGDATGGGGAAQVSGSFLMSDSVVTENYAGGSKGGPGLYFTAGTNVAISDSEISKNITNLSDPNASGGGVRHDGNASAMLVERSNLAGNIAWVGAGAYLGPGTLAFFVNTTMTRNYADVRGILTRGDSGAGSAVYADDAFVSFVGVTLKDNTGLTQITARKPGSSVRFDNTVLWAQAGVINCDGEGSFNAATSVQNLDWVGGSCPMPALTNKEAEVFAGAIDQFEAPVSPPGIPVEHRIWFPAPGGPLIHAGNPAVCTDPMTLANQDERQVKPRASCDIGAIEQ
ncbi:MAG TPA: hypothetical protein VKB52_09980 [Rhodanobacteraceae bacterium]|nr:hypothetical protein [Rhodanobacteraceae bacterium]